MRIVQEEPQYGKPLSFADMYGHKEYGMLSDMTSIDLHGASVKRVSEMTAPVARRHMGIETKHNDFTSPFNGKAYITYPLDVVVEVDIADANCYSSIVWQIAKAYAAIYEEEDKTTETPVLDESDRGMCLNRNETNGKYGIWGHDLGDLVFERLTIHEGGLITVDIGS